MSMWNLTAFLRMFRTPGYPIAAFSRWIPPSRRRGAIPVVFVTMDTDRGAQHVTYSQAEFATRYRC